MFHLGLPDESFHDAEVVTALLDRNGPSLELVVDAYPATDRTVRYRLRFSGLLSLEISDFNEQNAIFDLIARPAAEGSWEVAIQSSYGLGGTLSCREVAFEKA